MTTSWTPGEEARIGIYVLRQCLGKGGNGQVWLAWKDNPTGTPLPCVIKFPLPSYVKDQRAVEQFLAEGGMAMSVNMHANTVRVTDVGVFKGMPFIVMEFIDGTSLDKLLHHARKRHRRVSLQATYHVLASVASALHHAHYGATKAGKPINLVHRDIKPGNVLINRDGLVKLSDFGISAFLSDESTGQHIRGTSRYMSPEHVRSKVRPEMDVYALGIIGWELVENRIYRVECHGDQHYERILDGDIPPIYSTDVPEALTALLMRCLDVNPRNRPLALEFIKELKRCEGYSRDPDDIAREVQEMLGQERPSKTTEGVVAATPELIATLAVLDGHAVDHDEVIDPSDATPSEPEVDPSAVTVARRRPGPTDAVVAGTEERPSEATPAAATQILGPPAAVLRRADGLAWSRTEKVPAPPVRPSSRSGDRWQVPVALVLLGTAVAVGTIVLDEPPGSNASGSGDVPTSGPANAADDREVGTAARVAEPKQATDDRIAETGAVIEVDAPPPPTKPAASAPGGDDATVEVTGTSEAAPQASDPAAVGPSVAVEEPAAKPKREQPKPTIHVTLVLDMVQAMVTVKIGRTTAKVDGKRTDVKVPAGKHRVRWRTASDQPWQDGGRHRFDANRYLIRVGPSALRVIEVE